MKMERVVEIIRGWPYDGSLDTFEPIKAGVTLVNGDVVVKQSDNTIDKVGSTANSSVGLVITGNGDSSSGVNTGKAVVLWGNYVAKVSNFATGTYAPGDRVTAVNGVFAKAGDSDPVVGFVKDVVAASTTQTAHITIVVK